METSPRNHAARFCLFCSPHSNDKVIRTGRSDAGDVYDAAGNVIDTRENKGELKEW